MNIFKKFLSGRRAKKIDHDEADSEQEYVSYTEATAIARRDAKRDLRIEKDLISYVSFADVWFDYCLVEIRFSAPDKGVMTLAPLPLDNRMADEKLTNERIAEVARSGNKIAAIRLYRSLNSASLFDAKKAVEKMYDA